MRISDQEYNRLKVLRLLRASEPVARTDLARLSGLTGGTITAIVADLARRNLVLEEKACNGGLGRPRINLRLNPDAAYVAGCIISRAGMTVEIVNMKGDAVFTFTRETVPTSSMANLAEQISVGLLTALERAPVDRDRIVSVGVGLPAIVDVFHGVVMYFQTFEPGPFAMAAAIEARVGIPVTLDNDLNALARAEHWFGSGDGLDDFTLVQLDLAMGTASYVEGQLYAGTHGIRPEIGHTKIFAEGGRKCHCNAHGCVVAYSSIYGIVSQASELRGTPIMHWKQMSDACKALAAEARAGDAEIGLLFERAGRYLGVALANHINVQDPDRIILLYRLQDYIDLIKPHMLEALHLNTLSPLRDRAVIEFKAIDEMLFQKGCAAMVAEKFYLGR